MKHPFELKIVEVIHSYVVLNNNKNEKVRRQTMEMLDVLLGQMKTLGMLDITFNFLKDKDMVLTMLEYAVVIKNLSLIMKLLAAGADPNVGQRQPLYLACQDAFYDPNTLSLLLNYHKLNRDVIKTKVNKLNQATKCSALHIASSLNNVRAIQILLEHPDIDVYKNTGLSSQNHADSSALHLALTKKNHACVELLFEKIAATPTPLNYETITSIGTLLSAKEFTKALVLLNKMVEYQKTHPEDNVSKNAQVKLNGLFRYLIENPVDVSLYNAFIEASKIDINQSIPININGNNIEMRVLPWICVSSSVNVELVYEWIRFILNEGYDLNQLEINTSIFQAVAALVSVDTLKVILENGKVEQEHLDLSLQMAKEMKDIEKIKLLEELLSYKNNHQLVVQGMPLSFEMYSILKSDDILRFERILKKVVTENIAVILYTSIEKGAKNILISLLKDYNPFILKYEYGYNAFTLILTQGLLDVIDNLWKTYLLQEKYDLEKELQNCRAELLHIQERFPELPQLYFEILLCKIQILENGLIQKKQRQEALSSTAHTDGITFFKCISSRKYMMETHAAFLKEKGKEGADDVLEKTPKQHASPISHTWFDNQTLNLDTYIQIEKTDFPCYLVFLPGIDSHPDKVFENQSRYSFDALCLKTLTGLDLKMTFSVAGNLYDFEVSHELRSRKTDDRILIAKKSSEAGFASLYIAFKYMDGGLHDYADTKNMCMSIKNSKPIELDFLLENNKSNKPF